FDTDGSLIRFRVEGDRPGRKNGWAVLFADAHGAAGAFGSWRSGITGTWRNGRGKINVAERKRLSASIEMAKRARDAERLERVQDAAQRAARLWHQAAAPEPRHAYLIAKHVKAYGIRQLDDKLVIPARDAEGKLQTLEFIYPDGEKRFLAGGRKRGMYFSIGNVTAEVLIAEGYATGASLHEATGKPVAIAFDAGNLEPVARALRAKFPRTRIVIAADNDTSTPGNPGRTKATAAARAVGGYVAVPPEPFGDFNDAAIAELEIEP
ncbi:MAG: toprim domain-containing protein, partial [Gammaproteobacteria bacterium]